MTATHWKKLILLVLSLQFAIVAIIFYNTLLVTTIPDFHEVRKRPVQEIIHLASI